MTISIRPAQSTDIDAAVALIYSSGPDTFDYVFKRRIKNSKGFLRYAFIQDAGEFSYKNHVVAVDEAGQVTGIGCGFSGASTIEFALAAARQIIGFYGIISGLNTIRRGLQVEGIIKPPDRTLYIIAHMGVIPELQGQGIGQMLIEHLMATGKQAGYTRFGLDVSVENPRAQVLYERLGFAVTRENKSKLKNKFAQVANHRRMEMRV